LLGAGWFVSPMFVHPKPRRGIFSDVGFERIPTCLRDLLMAHAVAVDRAMKDDTIASIRQWFAMHRNNRRASLFVQPCMRRSHVRLQTKAIDRHRRKSRMQWKIHQQRSPAFSPKRLVKPDDPALARNEFVTGL